MLEESSSIGMVVTLSSFFKLLIIVLGLGLASSASPSFAQTSTDTRLEEASGTTEPTSESSNLDAWAGRLNSVERALVRDGITDAELAALVEETAKIRNEASEVSSQWREKLELIKQRLDALGPEPKEGEPPETEETQESRAAINKEYAEVDANAKGASDIAVRASQLRAKAAERRHSRFFRQITARAPSMVADSFVDKFFEGVGLFPRPFMLLFSDAASAAGKKVVDQPLNLFVLLFGVLLLALAFIRVQKWVSDIKENYSDAPLAVGVFFQYVRIGLLPALSVGLLFWLASALGFFTSRLLGFLSTGLIMTVVGVLAILLVGLILSPNSDGDRLARISTGAARQVNYILRFGLIAAICLSLADLLAITFVLPVETGVGLSFLNSIVVGVTGVLALELIRRDASQSTTVDGIGAFWSVLRWLAWLAAVCCLIAALVGYVALAEFLSHQLIFAFVVVVSAWLALKVVDYVSSKWLVSEEDETPSASGQQFAIFVNGLIYLAIYCSAAVAMMVPWGYRTSDLVDFVQASFFGLQVGEINFSFYNLLTAFALFLIGFWITRSLRSWMGMKFLPSTGLDIGLRNSITTMFGYVGLGIAALIAISAAGFDLSNLAIVAGALSLGIGFGLQSIINNFVSGLILLAERPIKSGDWIQTTDGEGIVRKISVRSTEIQTFDQATTIIPNSTLIADRVTNLTHLNKNGRLVLDIGVGYDCDPQEVKDLLLACAEEHPRIKKIPAPNVFFMEFGPSSLDFSLRCYLYDVNERLTVQSDLRFAVLAAMRAQNIEIPFPQRVITLNNATENND